MNSEREKIELMTRLASNDSEINNLKESQARQDERMDRMEDQFDAKTNRLEKKFDKIIDNERQLLETINNSGSALDDKIDERFNTLQMWLLGSAVTAGLGLLMFILTNVIK